MRLHGLMEQAALANLEVAGNVKADQLGLPTPCRDWDVRKLVNHLMFWSAFRSEVAARKTPPPDGDEAGADLVTEDWFRVYRAQLDRAVAAWGEAGAWEGETGMAGGGMPATMVGRMVIGELVLHGWDLARATGQELRCGDELAAEALDGATLFVEMAKGYGIFAEPVAVPESASVLDRALGLSGRDPNWSP